MIQIQKHFIFIILFVTSRQPQVSVTGLIIIVTVHSNLYDGV